jgi:uncharacterized RDD family membrane protein YckC
VPTFKIEKRKYDTNKLPALESLAEPETKADLPASPGDRQAEETANVRPDLAIRVAEEAPVEYLSDNDEIEDLAPISLRFNAALFDLIIGAFGSFILLSPAVFFGSEWLSLPGLMAFAATWSFAMFLYLTIAIGMYGKTVGMRMFALELIDADENDYPTFHQAAVNSAVYLLTLPFLGAGFVPMLFNEEQRAAHDLAAGTIIVNEL